MSTVHQATSCCGLTKAGILATTALAVLAAAEPARAAALPSDIGQWSAVYNWPNNGIHLSLLPNGKVLSWATGETTYPGKNTASVVEVPSGQQPSSIVVAANNTTSNLFCSGHAFLPDGKLFVTGGRSGPQSYGHSDVNIFNQAGNSWQTIAGFPKEYARWYGSALSLTNGEILLLAGNKNGYSDPNTLPQVWQAGGDFRNLSSAVLKVANYSKIFVAGDGRVFVAGPETTSRFLDTAGTGKWATGPKHKFSTRTDGTAVMYEDGKILVTAGGSKNAVPTNTAEIIDLNAATPAWQYTAPMANQRRHANATLLPDGKVLLTGGSKSKENNNVAGAILPAELWDPATGKWATMASLTIPRIYHSTAILLPDGRVLTAGGDKPTGAKYASQKNAQIYSPPYLFKGPRPTIAAAPTSIGYGQVFAVQTPDAAAIDKVRLIRLSSVTHSYNMNQRISSLSFTKSADSLSISVPANKNLLPAGDYMLFILNASGVPSVSKILKVT